MNLSLRTWVMRPSMLSVKRAYPLRLQLTLTDGVNERLEQYYYITHKYHIHLNCIFLELNYYFIDHRHFSLIHVYMCAIAITVLKIIACMINFGRAN